MLRGSRHCSLEHVHLHQGGGERRIKGTGHWNNKRSKNENEAQKKRKAVLSKAKEKQSFAVKHMLQPHMTTHKPLQITAPWGHHLNSQLKLPLLSQLTFLHKNATDPAFDVSMAKETEQFLGLPCELFPVSFHNRAR